jgi:hypothetical protein
MAQQIVELPYKYYLDPTRFAAISNAKIYVGEVDLDPRIGANQISVTLRQEDGTEVAASQPIRTSAGGVPLYNGSPVQLLVDQSYSIAVDDATDVQVYYAAQVDEPSVASYTTTGGAADTYTATIDGIAAYQEGQSIQVKINATNTGAVTIDVNGLGARDVVSPDLKPLVADQLLANGVYILIDDGARYQLQQTLIPSAIQHGNHTYAVDSGAADAYVVALSPTVISRKTGVGFRFKAGNNSTGASTINYGAGVFTLVNKDGSAIQADQIESGGIYFVTDDGTNCVLEVDKDIAGNAATADSATTASQADSVAAGGVDQAALEQPASGAVDCLCLMSINGVTTTSASPPTVIGAINWGGNSSQDYIGGFSALKSGTVRVFAKMRSGLADTTGRVSIYRTSPGGASGLVTVFDNNSVTTVEKFGDVPVSLGDVVEIVHHRVSGTGNAILSDIRVQADAAMFVGA